MKIITWNVNGIRAIVKKNFFESLEQIDADVICLQETKATGEEVKKALKNLNDIQIYTNEAEQKGYSGTSILSKSDPQDVIRDMGVEEHDKEGRILCAEYPGFFLINVYVPNSGQQLDRLDYRKQWDADFLTYIKEKEKSKPVIVCGDFNVAHRPIDLKNDKSNYNKTAGYTQVEIDGMDAFTEAGLVDVFRHFYPEKVAYTYWSYRFKARERNVGWRIDYFLVSKSLIKDVKKVEILGDHLGSDHCPVLLEVDAGN
ncbi:exodeoxyribonuclease III [Muriicola marianensis]|uniref:Exodeoxyribonuclease III n=1 Tax=Muriicola marianensis TaxID=1324801 RepID=A0ABQ1R7C5_9FLAO|nr:exodeoxyribonuclease III [Muriicola marianensis]GGD58227.1 exodeoxyribonuclease III [Muriicola marianensis]